LLLLTVNCSKDPLSKFEGIFDIRAMTIHPGAAYFYASSDSTHIYLCPNIIHRWIFTRKAGDRFTIGVDNDPLMVFYVNDFGGLGIGTFPPSSTDTRYFFTLSDTKDHLTASHSVSTGKYVYVPYCEKNGETWSYDVNLVDDLNSCLAVDPRTDSCYCINGFTLEK
jgi:hypothetical protein